MEDSLDGEEIKHILLILKSIESGLVTPDDWEEEVYGANLVDVKMINGIIKKLERMLPKNETKTVKKEILLGRFDEYHSVVDESTYSRLVGGFSNRQRVEAKYFSMTRRDFTKRRLDIYYMNRRYVIAFDHLGHEIRKFRTGRFVEVKMLESKYEVPSEFDKREYL